MKYTIVGQEKKIVEGEEYNLYRIQAIKKFGNVDAGTEGGLISSYAYLSQEGDCWVDKDSIVIESNISGDILVLSSIVIDSIAKGEGKIYKSFINNSNISNSCISNTNVINCDFKGIDLDNSTLTNWRLSSPSIRYHSCDQIIKNNIIIQNHGITFHKYNDILEIIAEKTYVINSYDAAIDLIDNIIKNNDFYDREEEADFRCNAYKIINFLFPNHKNLENANSDIDRVFTDAQTKSLKFIFKVIGEEEDNGVLLYVVKNPYGPGTIKISSELFIPLEYKIVENKKRRYSR